MLRIPESGFNTSTIYHNSDLKIAADWIEASLLFSNNTSLSKSDIVDILHEENIYREQDFAKEFVDNCWDEISRRHNNIRNNTYIQIEKLKLVKNINWSETPAYSFCLLTCLNTYYDFTIKKTDFINQQGELFEEVTKESLSTLFPNWNVFRTGYDRHTKKKFPQLLESISRELKISVKTESSMYFSNSQHDAKLDLILFRHFEDNYCNIPIYLFQCASGENWLRKKMEPSIEHWKKLLCFDSHPVKGFSIPYCLDLKEHRLHSSQIDGILLDRMRILSAVSIKQDWISDSLKRSLNRHNKLIFSKLKFFD
jgi:hypothetical protein